MAQPQFDYQGAKEAGYSDNEIHTFLDSMPEYKSTNTGSGWQNIKNNASNFFGNFTNPTQKQPEEEAQLSNRSKDHPNFDYEGALQAGYTPEEINGFLQTNTPDKTLLEQGSRIAAQYGIGFVENKLLPYELSVAPLSSKEAQNIPYREDLMNEMENLQIQKQSGQWSPEDEKFLEHIQAQINDPEKSMEYVDTMDIGVRDIAEKITGADLHPEGVLEKAANWIGFIKNPKKLFKTGIKKSDAIKAITPTGREILRGVGAGIALQAAEEGEFGPIGTMAAVVIGDVIGHGVGATVAGTKNLITKPKPTLAKSVASFTPKEKLKLQQEIIKEFRDSGIQADLGTITDSNLIKWTQARLAQSGLTGKALDDFRHELTDQIKREYKELAESLGNAKFSTSHEAGEVIKETVKEIRDSDLAASRQLYKNAEKALKESAFVDSKRLASSIEKIEKSLKPGSIKSGEQQAVLNALDKLKIDLYDSSGNLMYANVKELMNNKIALSDIINYEVQGGSKQLLKQVVSELDRAIISHGKDNPIFAKNYVNANKQFSEHAKTFRNKDISQLLKTENPSQLLNRMNNINGIRNLNKVLSKTHQGRELFNNLKRMKLDEVIGNKLVDSTTQQVKLGTFSKLLEKGKNRDIIKEILSPSAFKRLERLQKNAGRLADAADKFYNASKSGVVAADAAVISKLMYDFANLLALNPWPLMKTGMGLVGGRKLSQLLADPEFLKLTEEAMLAAEKSTETEMVHAFERLKPYALQYSQKD